MREVNMQNKKSTIAKLLAEEDISIVHKKTRTASFDVKKRELVLPIFKDQISNDVYDMFVCHEVGHSLWTPLDMLKKIHKEGIDHSVVNVIEDARIEAMIQKRYPGSQKNFTQGYKELLDRDFFGIKNKDLSKLNVIDKINIYFKTGLDVGFNTQEKLLADKVAKCKTPDDVIKLAIEISGYHKKKSKEDKKDELTIIVPNNAPKQEDEDSDNNESSSSDSNVDIEDNQDNDDNDSDSDGKSKDKNDDEKKDSVTQSQVGGNGAGLGIKSDLVAHTDAAYQSAMDDHNDHEARDRSYVNIPKVNLKNLIISYKTVLSDLKEHYKNDSSSANDFIHSEYTKILNDNKKVVSYMVKEFEMKKQADLYKRATIAKTGVLNMSKLHTYKYNDDLFAKMTTIPGATNHGMIMYVDWSGSMSDNMDFTLKQLYNLIWFCNRTKIPFQVLAFSDREHRQNVYEGESVTQSQQQKVGDMDLENVKLIELFSSNMTKAEQEEQIKNCIRMSCQWNYRHNRDMSISHVSYVNDKYNLGGTPLNHAIACAAQVIENFQMQTRVQKTNLIFLTDGDSHAARYYFDYKKDWNDNEVFGQVDVPYDNHIVYSDKTRGIKLLQDHESYYRNQQTTALLTMLKKQVPGLNITGFFIEGRGRHGRVNIDTICRKMGWSRGSDEQKILDAQKQLRKEKVLVCKSQGYDEYYILPRGPIDQGDDEILDIVPNAKSNQILKAFKKASGSKTLNRQLLNKFIDMVA
tara:strand:- start:19103 stop:21337 length:2235 start_codon:yes stop_codon:yes gene_type:complete